MSDESLPTLLSLAEEIQKPVNLRVQELEHRIEQTTRESVTRALAITQRFRPFGSNPAYSDCVVSDIFDYTILDPEDESGSIDIAVNKSHDTGGLTIVNIDLSQTVGPGTALNISYAQIVWSPDMDESLKKRCPIITFGGDNTYNPRFLAESVKHNEDRKPLLTLGSLDGMHQVLEKAYQEKFRRIDEQ